MWPLGFFAAPENSGVLRRGGYYVQITEVVGGSVMVQNCSAEIALCETVGCT